MTSFPAFTRRLALPVALSVAALSSGCLGTTDLPPEAEIETTQFAPALGVDLPHSVKLQSGVVIRDIVVGTGKAAAAPDSVFLNYAGFLSSGTKFDPTTGETSSLAFKLGTNFVIAGFELGVLGMQPGGRRQIIIPPSLAYGYAGAGPIPGNAVIVFNVELTALK